MLREIMMVKVVFFLWKLKPFKGKVEEDLQTKQEIKKKNSRK